MSSGDLPDIDEDDIEDTDEWNGLRVYAYAGGALLILAVVIYGLTM